MDNDIRLYGEKYNVLAVVGNKSDLYEKEEVEEDKARDYAESIGAVFMYTSAKSGDNIELLFSMTLGSYCFNKIQISW